MTRYDVTHRGRTDIVQVVETSDLLIGVRDSAEDVGRLRRSQVVAAFFWERQRCNRPEVCMWIVLVSRILLYP